MTGQSSPRSAPRTGRPRPAKGLEGAFLSAATRGSKTRLWVPSHLATKPGSRCPHSPRDPSRPRSLPAQSPRSHRTCSTRPADLPAAAALRMLPAARLMSAPGGSGRGQRGGAGRGGAAAPAGANQRRASVRPARCVFLAAPHGDCFCSTHPCMAFGDRPCRLAPRLPEPRLEVGAHLRAPSLL